MQKKAFPVIAAAAAAIVLAVPTVAGATGTAHRSLPLEDAFSIYSDPAPNIALQPVDNGSPAPVVLGDRNNSALQHWYGVYQGNGLFSYQNVQSGTCLTASAGGRGAPLISVVCGAGSPQEFHPVHSPTGHGFHLLTSNNMCMDTDRGELVPGTTVLQNPCSSAPSQDWQLGDYQE
jgi:hypothetical protein